MNKMLEILMQQAGIDPAQLKTFATDLANFIKVLQADLVVIKDQQAAILEKLDRLSPQIEKETTNG